MTEAEQVKHAFETATKTVSIATLAAKRGATRTIKHDFTGKYIFYHFHDTSVLGTKGTGRSHSYWTVPTQRHKAPPGECNYCDRESAAGNDFHPSHDASPGCESGKYSHCSCDTCF